ncbi:hypothetical protein [Nannocystis pusilla]|uniref:hypothetical protein n=1 Tax=Nannocystis pusilla TaxID=889268 RepID=UPI003DA209AF
MTEQQFMQRTQERLEQLRDGQRLLYERLATDLRQLQALRMNLNILAGTLALGLGLSVGYQLGRR